MLCGRRRWSKTRKAQKHNDQLKKQKSEIATQKKRGDQANPTQVGTKGGSRGNALDRKKRGGRTCENRGEGPTIVIVKGPGQKKQGNKGFVLADRTQQMKRGGGGGITDRPPSQECNKTSFKKGKGNLDWAGDGKREQK